MPIDYTKYPSNWKEIRERILLRDDNKCKHCGVKNHVVGYRDAKDNFIELNAMEQEAAAIDGDKVVYIVLTIAHLDHDEENHNVKDDRLAALCQRCHLRYDAKEKQRRIKNKKAIGRLFE